MGDDFEITGQLQEARQAYQRAMTYIPAQEYIWRARLQRKNAVTWQEAPADTQGPPHANALQGYEEAEHFLEQAPAKSRTECLQRRIYIQIPQYLQLRDAVNALTAVCRKTQL